MQFKGIMKLNEIYLNINICFSHNYDNTHLGQLTFRFLYHFRNYHKRDTNWTVVSISQHDSWKCLAYLIHLTTSLQLKLYHQVCWQTTEFLQGKGCCVSSHDVFMKDKPRDFLSGNLCSGKFVFSYCHMPRGSIYYLFMMHILQYFGFLWFYSQIWLLYITPTTVFPETSCSFCSMYSVFGLNA